VSALLATNDSRRVWEFMHDRLGLHGSEDFRGVLWVPDEFSGSVIDMDHVAVAVGYNAFIGRTCCMHAVIQRPEYVSPRIVREVFRYPFEVCNCEAVLALVDSTNDAAMSLDTRLGFKQVHTVPNGGTDGNLNVLQMLRSECRWLRSH
jgi:hypothetical protein